MLKFCLATMEGKGDEKHCQSCTKTPTAAVGFCKECDEHLCKICYEHHTIPKPCRNHNLLKLDDPKYVQLSSFGGNKFSETSPNLDIINEKCSIHSSYFIEFYCNSHHAVCCAYCCLKEHRACKVTELLEIKENYLYSDEVETCFKDLEHAKTDVDQIVQQIDKNRDISAESKSSCLSSIQDFSNATEKRLNLLEDDIKERANMLHIHTLDVAKEHCMEAYNKIKSEDLKLKSYREEKTPCKMYIELRAFENVKRQVDSDIAKARSNNIIKTFTFKPCSRLKRFLFEKVKVLGTLEEEVTGCDEYHVSY